MPSSSSTAAPITAAQLESTLKIAKLSLKTNYPVVGTDQWVALRTRALEELAHDAELRAWARGLGAKVTEKAVDDAYQQALAGAFPGKTSGSIDEAKLKVEFAATGMTPDLLRERIRTKLLAQAAADKIGGSPKVTDAQVLKQYDKDKKTVYALAERRKVRHILVKTKAEADTVYARLSSSDASFAELAKQYSTDTTKTNGGDLGEVTRTGVVKPFADVAFSLEQGVVSEPVKTEFGYHLIEATGPVLPKGTRPLDKTLKDQIRATLVQQARQKHIAEQFDKAVLELSKDIKFAPGYAPAIQTSQ